MMSELTEGLHAGSSSSSGTSQQPNKRRRSVCLGNLPLSQLDAYFDTLEGEEGEGVATSRGMLPKEPPNEQPKEGGKDPSASGGRAVDNEHPQTKNKGRNSMQVADGLEEKGDVLQLSVFPLHALAHVPSHRHNTHSTHAATPPSRSSPSHGLNSMYVQSGASLASSTPFFSHPAAAAAASAAGVSSQPPAMHTSPSLPNKPLSRFGSLARAGAIGSAGAHANACIPLSKEALSGQGQGPDESDLSEELINLRQHAQKQEEEGEEVEVVEEEASIPLHAAGKTADTAAAAPALSAAGASGSGNAAGAGEASACLRGGAALE